MTFVEKAYAGLSEHLVEEKAIEILLLSDDQMLIRKHAVPNPKLGGFKAPALVPAEDGFAIYLRCSVLDSSAERPEQRVTFPARAVRWNAETMTLSSDRATLDQSWKFLNHAGEHILITVHCGSEQVFDEVDRILTAIAACLS